MRAPFGSLSRTVQVGNHYDRLEVISIEGAYAITRCACGNIHKTRTTSLADRGTKSCGCLRREGRGPVHGHARTGSTGLTPTYMSWQSMLRRCEIPSASGYAWYGGRGITVAPEWHDFQTFLRDMGERPSSSHSLDRIDPNGHYMPGNCRWATKAEQSRNLRTNVWITFNGETLCMTDWAKRTGLSVTTIRNRLHAGLPEELILTRKDLRHEKALRDGAHRSNRGQ